VIFTTKMKFRTILNKEIMKDIVTQRVREVLEYKNVTPNALANKLGIHQQTISKQLKEDGCGVSLTTIVGMLNLFPDISAEWLLRGAGRMTLANEGMDVVFSQSQNELVGVLKEHIAMLTRFNENLLDEVRELRSDNMEYLKKGAV